MNKNKLGKAKNSIILSQVFQLFAINNKGRLAKKT